MKWITRARPKTDRIACPWLIERFIDSEAQFIFLPADQVIEAARIDLYARSFDAPGAYYTHDGSLCTFEVRSDERAPGPGHSPAPTVVSIAGPA